MSAITCFRMGRRPPSITIRRVASVHELGRLDQDRDIPRHRFAEAARWSALTRAAPGIPTGYVELGELCRVQYIKQLKHAYDNSMDEQTKRAIKNSIYHLEKELGR